MIDKETHKYRTDYATWFQTLEWDYFFTGTFKNWDITPNGARRACERFFKQYESKQLIVLFIEFGAMYGKVHVHGLLRFNPLQKPSNKLIWEHWFSKYGRAKVEEIESRENVSNYCTKYITKDLHQESLIIIT